jgi:hypothetical protein
MESMTGAWHTEALEIHIPTPMRTVEYGGKRPLDEEPPVGRGPALP